jgi:CopG family transcriptional regulator, nickel-responsive regulator
METKLVRIGFVLPENIQNNFNEVIKNRGYATHSEALREVMRKFISDYEKTEDFKGHHAGIAAIIHTDTGYGFTDTLVDVQHHYSHLIKFSVKIFFGSDSCLETVVLDGNFEEINELAKAMTAPKRVKFIELSTIPIVKKI